MPSFKAETISKVLADAKTAQPIEEIGKHTYSPEEYNKIRGGDIMMANLDNSEFLEPNFNEGDIEFNKDGTLRKIGRSMPKMIDERMLTANRYKVVVKNEEKDKNGKVVKTTAKEILVVFGRAIVNAIEKSETLPNQIKAYRFVKTGNYSWTFKGVEFITDTEARTFLGTFDAASWYKLQDSIAKSIEENAALRNANGGSSLNDL